jgi:hypothetical protein
MRDTIAQDNHICHDISIWSCHDAIKYRTSVFIPHGLYLAYLAQQWLVFVATKSEVTAVGLNEAALLTYPFVGLLMDTSVRWTPGESRPSTYWCSL